MRREETVEHTKYIEPDTLCIMSDAPFESTSERFSASLTITELENGKATPPNPNPVLFPLVLTASHHTGSWEACVGGRMVQPLRACTALGCLSSNPAPPLTSYMIWGKLFNLSVPLFPYQHFS